jgi:putative ABC transport system substrate-binding protein
MRRREFVGLLSSAAAWPFAANAQQALPVIGFVRSATLADVPHYITAFREGLKETGYVEGRNVAIEYHSADNDHDRLLALVTEFIRSHVAVIVGDNLAALAAKTATTTVPIVFAGGGDPVQEGLVASLNEPGGNVTGVNFFTGPLGSKRLELLRQLSPMATTIAVLVYPNTTQTEAERSDLQAAAQGIGQQILIFDVTSSRDIETAFSTLVQRGIGALLVGTGAFLYSNRERLVALATNNRLPGIYSLREYAIAGGLMSYGASTTDAYREVGIYAGRILQGEKPGEMPVIRASKFELTINLNTARTLGLTVPESLLARADEVIE